MQKQYLYYKNGRLTMPVVKVELVMQLPMQRWRVKSVNDETEFEVKEELLLPKPFRGFAAENDAVPIREGSEKTYIYYAQAKFEPPFFRVLLKSRNDSNDTYTVFNVKNGQITEGVKASMLMPRPFLALVADKGKENTKSGKEKSPPSPPPPKAAEADGPEDASQKMARQQAVKDLQDQINDSALAILARYKEDKDQLWYGEVRGIDAPDKIIVEFIDGSTREIVFRDKDIEIGALLKQRDVQYPNDELILSLIEQLMQTKPVKFPFMITDFFDLLMNKNDANAERTAYESLFERLIRTDRQIILEQRKIIQKEMLDKWLFRPSSSPYDDGQLRNIWLGCMYEVAEEDRTFSTDTVFRNFIKRLKKKRDDYLKETRGKILAVPKFDMRYIFEHITFLRTRKAGRGKINRFFRQCDKATIIWYTIQLFNDVYGDNGLGYEGYLLEIFEDEEEADLVDSYYTLYEIELWKQAVLKTKFTKKIDNLIENAFDLLVEKYVKIVEFVMELDHTELDPKLNEEKIRIGDLKFAADYKKVIKVMREFMVEIENAGKLDDLGERGNVGKVEEAFQNVIRFSRT